jgi:hypothetical protein
MKEAQNYCALKDTDFTKAIVDAGTLFIDAYLTNEQRKKISRKPISYYLCQCKRCEDLEWIAHAYKKRRIIAFSKRAFEKELNNESGDRMGIFTLIYAVMHEYLHILHPYSTEKTIENKTDKYFRNSMRLIAEDGLKLLKERVGAF